MFFECGDPGHGKNTLRVLNNFLCCGDHRILEKTHTPTPHTHPHTHTNTNTHPPHTPHPPSPPYTHTSHPTHTLTPHTHTIQLMGNILWCGDPGHGRTRFFRLSVEIQDMGKHATKELLDNSIWCSNPCRI